MARKQTVKQKPATRNKSVKRPVKRPVKKAVKKASLGRPRIAGTAELDMEFRGDFGARQIFQFLDVQTFQDVEAFSSLEFSDRVITPLVQAVERIRKQLAMANRHLAGDQKFAQRFQSELAKVTQASKR